MEGRRALRGVVDTSVFVARERDRPLEEASLPEEAAVSVVTFAELELGVLTARDHATRRARMTTLAEVGRRFAGLPVDRAVASEFAALVAEARDEGRRPKALDALIGATARAHAVPVYTQDADFEGMPGVESVRV